MSGLVLFKELHNAPRGIAGVIRARALEMWDWG